MFFVVKNATRYALLMQLQVKLQKAAEITYLEARYCVTYLQVLELRKKVGWCFQGQNTAPNENVTF